MSASGTSRVSLKVQRLAVAAHRADPHAERRPPESPACRSPRRGRGSCWSRPCPSTLRALRPPPRSLSIHGISEPPSGTPKLFGLGSAQRTAGVASSWRSISRIALARVVQQVPAPRRSSVPNCVQQLAHVLRAAAGSGLVGLRAHPLDQAGLVQRAHAHQHAADGAVAADPVACRP